MTRGRVGEAAQGLAGAAPRPGRDLVAVPVAGDGDDEPSGGVAPAHGC
ncbi:hypothetical protein [Nonomuraea basaltis]|nr:hypothetical protein [Nonomuraea basaltis]